MYNSPFIKMDYIQLSGYKTLKNIHLKLAPINILIGANGSGKSNFMSFFDFLNRLYNRSLREYIALKGGENKILFQGKKVTDEISFEVAFDEMCQYKVLLKWGDNSFVFNKEEIICQDNTVSVANFYPDSQLKLTNNKQAAYVLKQLEGFRKYHFHDTGNKSPFTQQSSTQNDIHYLYSDGANIAAFLYNIQQEYKITYNIIIKTIQSIAPYFSDFYLVPNANNEVKLQWKDKYSDTVFGVTDLSDGTLRFMALTTLFLQPNLPNTIVIDEPELGLHPAAISKLAAMIQSAADKKCQVIVATQSTDLISYFTPEDVVTVDRVKGETIFKRLSKESLQQWLDDYTLDDLWKRSVIETGQPNYL